MVEVGKKSQQRVVWKVSPYDFSDELKAFLEELGYVVEIDAIHMMGIIKNIKIIIRWGLINE